MPQNVSLQNAIWVGHRGYPERYPENSLLGIEQALLAGAKAIEIDVQISHDDEPVLFHDPDLSRVTGQSGNVREYSLKELKTFSVHEPERFGQRFNPCYMAHLSQVVDLMKCYPGVRLFVELKGEVFDHVSRLFFLQKVWSLLEPIRQDCILISFDLYVLRLAQEQWKAPVGWVLTQYDALSLARVRACPVDYLICNIRKLPPFPELVWQGPWEWFVYDVVDTNIAHECVARGIRWIETWDIGGMLKTVSDGAGSCTT